MSAPKYKVAMYVEELSHENKPVIGEKLQTIIVFDGSEISTSIHQNIQRLALYIDLMLDAHVQYGVDATLDDLNTCFASTCDMAMDEHARRLQFRTYCEKTFGV